MQASCYSIRFGGSLLGAILGTKSINTLYQTYIIYTPYPLILFTHPLLTVLSVTRRHGAQLEHHTHSSYQ